MHFDTPHWLWLLPLVLLWGGAWTAVLQRNYRRRQRHYADTTRPYLKLPGWALTVKLAGQALLIGAAVCLVFALGRPQGDPRPSASARRGVNLAILVDGSRSMLCEDVLPTRLQAARQAVETLATTTAGSRFALFMFGGAPTLLIPRTFDTAAVTIAARSISPDFVGKGGTALEPALKRATEYLAKAAGSVPQFIVIISDGEEGQGDPVLTAMQAHAERQVRIHTVTIGTEEGGPIPLFQRNPKGELERAGEVRNLAEQPILTRADPALMAKLAEAGGGKALHLTGGDIAAQVRHFAGQVILPEFVALDDVATEEPAEWFWVPLLGALFLVLAEQALRRWVAHRCSTEPLSAPRGPILSAALEDGT